LPVFCWRRGDLPIPGELLGTTNGFRSDPFWEPGLLGQLAKIPLRVKNVGEVASRALFQLM